MNRVVVPLPSQERLNKAKGVDRANRIILFTRSQELTTNCIKKTKQKKPFLSLLLNPIMQYFLLRSLWGGKGC